MQDIPRTVSGKIVELAVRNIVKGDCEPYRQFCVGRAKALAAGYGDQPPMPAATVIGTDSCEHALQVYFLTSAYWEVSSRASVIQVC